MISCSFQTLGKELKRQQSAIMKVVRRASYKTLEDLAEASRTRIISNYPSIFKDQNGVHKNQGVPKMTGKTKVNKQRMSIDVGWAMRKSVDFMDDQEFGGVRKGMNGGAKAQPTWFAQRLGRTSTGKMKAGMSVKNLMDNIIKYEDKRSKERGIPRPFLMTARNGHKMIARRKTKDRDSYEVLYHLDHKVRIRKRWKFAETVKGVVIAYKEQFFKNYIEEFSRNLK